MPRILFSKYLNLNVYVRSLEDSVEVEVRYAKSTSILIKQFKGTKNDAYVNRLLDKIEEIASSKFQTSQGSSKLGLTRREQQLARLIGQDLSNKEIASQLNLSEQTVKNHVHRMLRKLGVSDRMGAVEVCRIQGIVA